MFSSSSSKSVNRTKIYCIKDKFWFAVQGDGRISNSESTRSCFAKILAKNFPSPVAFANKLTDSSDMAPRKTDVHVSRYSIGFFDLSANN